MASIANAVGRFNRLTRLPLHFQRSNAAAMSNVSSRIERNVSCKLTLPRCRPFENANQRQTHSTTQQLDPNSRIDQGLRSVEDVADRRMIRLNCQNGESWLFPYIFLRDSCQCKNCFHPFTKARLILMRDLKVDSYPVDLQIDHDNSQLLVTWDDGHVSPFEYSWLEDHAFTDRAARKQDNLYYRKPTLWGKDLQDKHPTAVFDNILNDDHALYKWLTDIEEFGFCLIKNAPKEAGQLKRIGDRVSFLRQTYHGFTFDVVSKSDPSNLAYTPGPLGLHTDVPYDRYPPGAQLLHCIIQTKCKGGENQFSDSFYAAKILERDYPEYYHLLCTAPIDFIDVGNEHYGAFFKLGRHPTFSKDMDGNIVTIQSSNQTRDSFLKQPVDQVEPMIRALRKLDDILYENNINLKMEEGDIATFANRRVLHGRNGYEEDGSIQRFLEGGYIDLDELNSKRRTLKEKLGIDDFQS